MPGRISSYPESACDVGWLEMFKHTYVIDHVKNNVNKLLLNGPPIAYKNDWQMTEL